MPMDIPAVLNTTPPLTCVDRLFPNAQPCGQLPQSTQPLAFLGIALGVRPDATAPFHKLVWCWLILREAGAGHPGARCEYSVFTFVSKKEDKKGKSY